MVIDSVPELKRVDIDDAGAAGPTLLGIGMVTRAMTGGAKHQVAPCLSDEKRRQLCYVEGTSQMQDRVQSPGLPGRTHSRR